jgi:hypothetical protein
MLCNRDKLRYKTINTSVKNKNPESFVCKSFEVVEGKQEQKPSRITAESRKNNRSRNKMRKETNGLKRNTRI